MSGCGGITMRRRPSIDPVVDTPEAAWAAGLRALARRELSVAQLRERLTRMGWSTESINAAIGRLSASGALDDARVARASARTRAGVKRQGRERVVREIQALGIARDVARAAVDEVFGALDERALLQRALDKRLRGRATLSDPAARRRLRAALVRQGFDADAVARVIRERSREAEDE
jgi:regulatory protein